MVAMVLMRRMLRLGNCANIDRVKPSSLPEQRNLMKLILRSWFPPRPPSVTILIRHHHLLSSFLVFVIIDTTSNPIIANAIKSIGKAPLVHICKKTISTLQTYFQICFSVDWEQPPIHHTDVRVPAFRGRKVQFRNLIFESQLCCLMSAQI